MATIEKMLDSVPSFIINEKVLNDKKEPVKNGLCLRYIHRIGMWVCGYGKGIDPTKSNKEINYVGTGFTPIEAVDDFIKNCLKNHEISKR